MPEKTKKYNRVIFTPEVIKEAFNTLEEIIPKGKRQLTFVRRKIVLSPQEEWEHDTDEEFFADYIKGFESASFSKSYESAKIEFWIYMNNTSVTVSIPSRAEVESVFNVLESNVDKCRLPKEPKKKSKIETDWVTETVNRIETHCPLVARKIKLALLKLDLEDVEEWQNATMLIRDAWIELSQWLCQVKDIDVSDIPSDSVVDRLRKLNMDKIDERLFNLARASFNLYGKHHKRDIELDVAVACVISTIVSMKTVIMEVLYARG